jgi:CRP-like cAMP-binding protein
MIKVIVRMGTTGMPRRVAGSPAETIWAKLPAPLRAAAQRRTLDRGELLFQRGDVPAAVFHVVTGEVQLIRFARNGTALALQRTTQGFVAEASLDQPAYHCAAIAARATTLQVLPIAGFRLALADPVFQAAWVTHLTAELRRIRARAERLSLPRARDRIVHFIESEGSDGRWKRDRSKLDWARDLGLTHEALYRALAAMRRNGTLEDRAGTLVLL